MENAAQHTTKKTYLAVFFTLAVLTAVTVLVSYLHLDRPKAIALALLIAGIKVSLIVAFFMHFKSEQRIIRMIFFAAFFLALVLLFMIIPDLGWSCPVCFGETGSNLAKGFTWGILLLLLLPLILFCTIAYKIISAIRAKNENSNPHTPAIR